MTENPSFKKLAKEIDELGLSQEFKAYFLGSVQVVPLQPQQLIIHEGTTPNSVFLVQEGSVAASQKKEGQNVSNMWRIQDLCWVGFLECLQEKPSAATFKSSSKATILQIDRSVLLGAQKKFPEDFDSYFKWVAKLERSKEDVEAVEDENDVDAEELFADARVLKKHPLWFKYPWVQQNDQMDCGPACLAMISKFWGNELSIQFWRQKLQTNQLGTTLFDLAGTAEKYGFLTHPIGVESITDVGEEMLPAIVLRQYHYMVLYAVTPKYVILGDPGTGVRKMSH